MKVIENMEPWQVMQAYAEQTEDKPVRVVMRQTHTQEPMEWQIIPEPSWNWAIYEYAIIDEEPELAAEWWDGFDWEFFAENFGLLVLPGEYNRLFVNHPMVDTPDIELTETPFYPWQGGKQPVPDNVEVEGLFFDIDENCNHCGKSGHMMAAKDMQWNNSYLIAFRITGKIIN